MNISFNELRDIKHKLPTGSVSRIAQQLNISEQTVRNYFGANKFEEGEFTGKHVQSGPDGGIVHLEDTTILDTARMILEERKVS
ncbi:MAG: DNA-binding protein [Saprospiraceae bacterium]|nr:DNA-binding protein [Saprospiraceae bacterium]